MKINISTYSYRSDQLPRNIRGIIIDLRSIIDQIDISFKTAKELIQKIASEFDKQRVCKTSQLCRQLKKILEDKIKEGKISVKWIEESLPTKYKRAYSKSEHTSLLENDIETKTQKILINTPRRSSCISTLLSHEGTDRSSDGYSKFTNTPTTDNRASDEYSSAVEIKFTIPKEKYDKIKTTMNNTSNYCHLIFDRNTGLLLRSESGETWN